MAAPVPQAERRDDNTFAPVKRRAYDDEVLSGLNRRLNGGDNTMDPKNPDPLISGLLAHLPAPGDVWPDAQRKRWLSLMEGAFDLIYKDQPNRVEEKPHEERNTAPGPGLTANYDDERPPPPVIRSLAGNGNKTD